MQRLKGIPWKSCSRKVGKFLGKYMRRSFRLRLTTLLKINPFTSIFQEFCLKFLIIILYVFKFFFFNSISFLSLLPPPSGHFWKFSMKKGNKTANKFHIFYPGTYFRTKSSTKTRENKSYQSRSIYQNPNIKL